MKFEGYEIRLCGALLASWPFNGSWLLVQGVRGALEHGNGKHGGELADPLEHIGHALAHLRRNGTDEETGLPDKVHAAARCLLALICLARASQVATEPPNTIRPGSTHRQTEGGQQ